MAGTGNEPRIVQQKLALDTYLRTLLEELPDPEQPSEPATASSVEPAQPPRALTPVRRPEIATAGEQPASAVNFPLAVMPEWAQREFQAIFFKVGPLTLATPLTELMRTIKFDRPVTKIPGQPSWFLGLLEDQRSKIGILDARQLILGKPEGLKRELLEQPFKSLLLTRDGQWALACDELLSIGKLTAEQVRWRTRRERRPWLIGTVIEQLTAVIDVNQLMPRRKTG